MTARNRQEQLWSGAFGDEYIDRNQGADLIRSNTVLFERIFSAMETPPSSVLELGCNVGNNLKAIRELLPDATIDGVEINERAAAEVEAWGGAGVTIGSLLDHVPSRTYDFTFTKGVLIHLNPDRLGDAYRRLVESSDRYVVVCEYYNPTPVGISYRGEEDALFKRDFAGELLDAHPGVRLVDYGFTYHRDPVAPLDDSTWFLLERT